MPAYVHTCIALIALVTLEYPAMTRSDGSQPNATGAFLLSDCTAAVKMLDGEEDANAVKSGFCFGYLSGFVAGHNAAVFENRRLAKDSNAKLAFCTTGRKISAGQLARVVVTFLQAHLNTLDLPMEFLTMKAFSEAFPCGSIPQ